MLGQWVYIKLYFDKDDPDLYVKKFKFMNDECIEYLESIKEKFVNGRTSLPRALFTLNLSKHLKEL